MVSEASQEQILEERGSEVTMQACTWTTTKQYALQRRKRSEAEEQENSTGS